MAGIPRFGKKYPHFQKELPMYRNRLVMSTAIAAGFIFLFAATGQARANEASTSALHNSTTAAMAGQPGRPAATNEDIFAGLDLTADQKAEVDKIRQSTKASKALVAKDTKLTPEQKDAFIVGYTRLESGQIFKILTPLQQKIVRKRMRDRQAADQSAHMKQTKPPQK